MIIDWSISIFRKEAPGKPVVGLYLRMLIPPTGRKMQSPMISFGDPSFMIDDCGSLIED